MSNMNNPFINRMGKHFAVEHIGPGIARLSREWKVGEESGTYSVEINVIDLLKWVNGEYVQSAFPYLSADQREFLVSGLSPAEYTAMFGEDE